MGKTIKNKVSGGGGRVFRQQCIYEILEIALQGPVSFRPVTHDSRAPLCTCILVKTGRLSSLYLPDLSTAFETYKNDASIFHDDT